MYMGHSWMHTPTFASTLARAAWLTFWLCFHSVRDRRRPPPDARPAHKHKLATFALHLLVGCIFVVQDSLRPVCNQFLLPGFIEISHMCTFVAAVVAAAVVGFGWTVLLLVSYFARVVRMIPFVSAAFFDTR